MATDLVSAIRFMTGPSCAEAVHERAPSATMTSKAKRARCMNCLPSPTQAGWESDEFKPRPEARSNREWSQHGVRFAWMPHRSNEYSSSTRRHAEGTGNIAADPLRPLNWHGPGCSTAVSATAASRTRFRLGTKFSQAALEVDQANASNGRLRRSI